MQKLKICCMAFKNVATANTTFSIFDFRLVERGFFLVLFIPFTPFNQLKLGFCISTLLISARKETGRRFIILAIFSAHSAIYYGSFLITMDIRRNCTIKMSKLILWRIPMLILRPLMVFLNNTDHHGLTQDIHWVMLFLSMQILYHHCAGKFQSPGMTTHFCKSTFLPAVGILI